MLLLLLLLLLLLMMMIIIIIIIIIIITITNNNNNNNYNNNNNNNNNNVPLFSNYCMPTAISVSACYIAFIRRNICYVTTAISAESHMNLRMCTG